MPRILIRYQYATGSTDGAGCPLCGGEVEMRVATGMGLHSFWCDRCKVEFTVEEGDATIREALQAWDRRDPGAGPEDCPFCGSPIREWPWGHYLFDSLWCPACRKRVQFQGHPHSVRSMTRTMREFGRRH